MYGYRGMGVRSSIFFSFPPNFRTNWTSEPYYYMTLHARTEVWPYLDSMINVESKYGPNLVPPCMVIEE